MSGKQAGPKRKHHVLQRLYLKGFSEGGDGRYIHEYFRGMCYSPGRTRGKSNPCRVSTKRAGVARDAYAFIDVEGQQQFELVENELEAVEAPIAPIFEKLRRQNPIDAEEKLLLSRYTILTWKRVPARNEASAERITKAMEGYDLPLLTRLAAEEGRRGLAKRMAYEPEEFLAERAHEMTRRAVALELPMVTRALASMTWQFVRAEPAEQFVTSDDPVYWPAAMGLGKPESWLVFPLTSRLALVASRIVAEDLAIIPAPKCLVSEINGIVLDSAQSFAYAAEPLQWVAERLNGSRGEKATKQGAE